MNRKDTLDLARRDVAQPLRHVKADRQHQTTRTRSEREELLVRFHLFCNDVTRHGTTLHGLPQTVSLFFFAVPG